MAFLSLCTHRHTRTQRSGDEEVEEDEGIMSNTILFESVQKPKKKRNRTECHFIRFNRYAIAQFSMGIRLAYGRRTNENRKKIIEAQKMRANTAIVQLNLPERNGINWWKNKQKARRDTVVSREHDECTKEKKFLIVVVVFKLVVYSNKGAKNDHFCLFKLPSTFWQHTNLIVFFERAYDFVGFGSSSTRCLSFMIFFFPLFLRIILKFCGSKQKYFAEEIGCIY